MDDLVKSSKAKGSKFECELLKQCREVNPDTFRTTGSGAVDYDQGDLIFGPYLIEAKHHKDFTDGLLEKFFLKAEEEATNRGKIPLLVFKKNRRKTQVMFRNKTYNYMFVYWDDFLKNEAKKNE